ncbi:hypothetical protein [Mycolicibacterium rhodesiae]|uniref:Polyketide cyclase / dehydrase and lipid transport n=1 Tax=Mycolicibacterium rhodesiae TaxID=36814 RepID=A0A1X0IWD3_MYCRH|nr:hypothetical protein [Mycolicibacterium rhodesiae]MCV7343018.1 hypothetical protein [Mycolicibacterium rhodesiae]ORB52950.1 hypothetical protein BST42_12990 [Mycolicibacterium rhodesiae]
MSVLDNAKGQIAGLVDKIADNAPHTTAQQTVTVACTVIEAEELWRDARRLSEVLGELGEVRFTEPNRYHWHLHAAGVDLAWESRLVSDTDALRFVGSDGNEIIVEYRPAPNNLGTELMLRTKTPAPELLSGAAAFTVLYRVRALLQTGEIPTIRRNPSSRASAR